MFCQEARLRHLRRIKPRYTQVSHDIRIGIRDIIIQIPVESAVISIITVITTELSELCNGAYIEMKEVGLGQWLKLLQQILPQ